MKQDNLLFYAPFDSGSGSGTGSSNCWPVPEVKVIGSSLNSLSVEVPSAPPGVVLQLELRQNDQDGFKPIGEPVDPSLFAPGSGMTVTDLDPCTFYWLRWTQLSTTNPSPNAGGAGSG